jgi:pyruvate,orthophosphate dikinase
MMKLNLPVPPGFVISTEACLEYLGMGDKVGENKGTQQMANIPDHLIQEYVVKIHEIERQTHRLFGSTSNELPLLLSVRSGAAVSMPGKPY